MPTVVRLDGMETLVILLLLKQLSPILLSVFGRVIDDKVQLRKALLPKVSTPLFKLTEDRIGLPLKAPSPIDFNLLLNLIEIKSQPANA